MKNIFLMMMCLLANTVIAQQQREWANFGKYAAENKSLLAQAKKGKRVVLMGDSITEFWKVFDSAYFIKTGYIDRGISGQTTSEMLVRFRPDVIDIQADVVVILAGINDIAHNNGPITIEQIFGNIQSMVELAKANNIKVVLCSVLPAKEFPWRKELTPANDVIALNKLIQVYAYNNHIPYVDYYSAMVDEEKGLNKKYGDDGVHPHIGGYKLMAEILEQTLKAL